MVKNFFKTINIFDLISKYSIYLLIFLFPIFFLPWTADATGFNKQALLIVLVFISAFAWMMKISTSSKARFNLILLHIPVIAFLLVYVASTVFSLWKFGSFWGWPLNTSSSLLSLIGLFFLYLLLSNVLEKKEIFYSIVILGISSFAAIIYGILQLFGKFIIPLPFTQGASFNTVGSVNALALFVAVMVPIFVVLAMVNKRVLRAVFILALLASVMLLIMIDFSSAWWVLVIGSAALIVMGTQKRDLFDNRWLIIPMFFLVIALLFNFFSVQIPTHGSRLIEVYLAQKPSWIVSWETVKESPILGSGPGTFVYDFAKYEKAEWFNDTNFWNVRFDSAGSKSANILATTGVLGAVSFLSMIGFAVFYGIKLLFFSKKEQEGGSSQMWMTGVAVFASFLALIGGYAFYKSNLSLEFLFFLLIGGIAALVPAEKKEIKLKSSSWVNLIVTFLFTIVFIFGLGLLILEGQRYAAEVRYKQGREAWARGESDQAVSKMEKAARTNPNNDLYWRDLAQIYLQKVGIDAARQDLSRAQKNQRIQLLVSNAIASSKAASDANSANVANWSVRGFVYRNLIGRVEGVGDWTLNSYGRALELEPTNPYYPTQSGVALLNMASMASEEKEREIKISSAKEKFRKALELKSNYAPARFQLALAFQMEDNLKGAIAELKEAKKAAPMDVGLAFQLGLVYYQQGEYRSAQQEFERAVGIDPNYANALYFLGLTYDQQGMGGEAVRVIERLAELNPDNEQVQKVLNNLKEGKAALAGLRQSKQAPIQENPPEIETEEEAEEEEK